MTVAANAIGEMPLAGSRAITSRSKPKVRVVTPQIDATLKPESR